MRIKIVAKTLAFSMMAMMLLISACAPTTYQPLHPGDQDLLVIGGKPIQQNDVLAQSVVAVEGYNEKNCIEIKDNKTGKRLKKCPISFCTGVIVSDSTIVSAAHCLPKGTTKVDITFGVNKNLPLATRVSTQFTRVPEFDEIETLWKIEADERTPEETDRITNGENFDLSVIHFTGGLPKGFVPAKLATEAARIYIATELYVVGYGINAPHAVASRGILRSAQVFVADPKFTASEILVDNSQKKGFCNGDSGGPAFMKIKEEFYLVGTHSRVINGPSKEDCTDRAVSTDIRNYMKFIATSEATLKQKPLVK